MKECQKKTNGNRIPIDILNIRETAQEKEMIKCVDIGFANANKDYEEKQIRIFYGFVFWPIYNQKCDFMYKSLTVYFGMYSVICLNLEYPLFWL